MFAFRLKPSIGFKEPLLLAAPSVNSEFFHFQPPSQFTPTPAVEVPSRRDELYLHTPGIHETVCV